MKKKYIFIVSIIAICLGLAILIVLNFYLIFGRISYIIGSESGIVYATKKMGESGDEKYIPFIREIVDDWEYSPYCYSIAQFKPEPMVKGLLIDARKYAAKWGHFTYEGVLSYFTGKKLTAGIRYLLYYKHNNERKYNDDYKPLEKVRIFEIWFQNNLPYLKRHLGTVMEIRLVSDKRPWPQETKYWEVDIEAKVCSVPYEKWKDLNDTDKIKNISEALNISPEEFSRMTEDEIDLKIRYKLADQGLDPIIHTSLDPDEKEITKDEWYTVRSAIQRQLYLMPEKYRPIHKLFIEKYDYSQLNE